MMTRFPAVVAALLASGSAHACELDLAGTWKSDGEASIAYLRENTRMPPHTVAFLEAILGRMTMEFAGGEIHTAAPDTQVPVRGELQPFAGFEETKPYRVVFCNSSIIAFTSKATGSNEDDITVFNFVGPDTAWIYTGTTNTKVPDLHLREFFQRIR